MGLQVDYIPVSDGKCCGDAISLRHWDDANPTEQKVIVIDGGNIESGEKLVNHIISNYGTNSVDYVFSTHLDSDHLSGLKVVLEKLDVSTLYMHLPWDHASETSDLYKGNLTQTRLETNLQKSLEQVADIQEIAINRNVAVEEIFTGDVIGGNILVLGPSKEYYELLTSQFRDTPEAKSALTQAMEAFAKMGERIEEQVTSKVLDFLHIDILGNGGETSAENNSSLVLLFFIDNHKLLFAGDAGIPALTNAADYAEGRGILLNDLRFFHVPHHGSKHNLGSDLLKRIKAGSAVVSASENCSHKHPSKRITNALYKNGTYLNKTWGSHLLHHHNAPRPGWNTIEREPFYSEFEED